MSVKASDSGYAVDEGELDVKTGRGTILWNVAGLSPIYKETVVYANSKNSAPEPTEPESYCQRVQINLDGDVDYLFADAPKSISMSSSTTTVSKTVVNVEPSGLQSCLLRLAESGMTDAQVHVMDVVAHTSVKGETLRTVLWELIGGGRSDAAERIVTELRNERTKPGIEFIEINRLYQDVHDRGGHADAVRAEYIERSAKAPESADALYLTLRTDSQRGPTARLDEAVRKFPKHAYLRLLHAKRHFERLEFAAASESFEALSSLEPSVWAESILPGAKNLVGLKDTRGALAALERAFPAAAVDDTKRREIATLYVLLGTSSGSADPFKLVRKLPAASSTEATAIRMAITKLRAGVSLDENERKLIAQSPLAKLANAAPLLSSKPKEALALIESAKVGEMVIFNDDFELVTLLLCEAFRTAPNSPALARLSLGLPKQTTSLHTFVETGTEDEHFDELGVEQRAAAYFVRSRVTTLSDRDQARLLARAQDLAFVPGPVSRAIKGWSR